MSAVAVVLAGGVGTRMGGELPKQLIELAGRPILLHSIAAFQAAPEIDEIVVVMAATHLEEGRDLLASTAFDKLSHVVAGGATRTESTRRALALLDQREGIVLFHDAARPLVTPELIGACVRALQSADAVTAAVASHDTVASVVAAAGGLVVTGIADRARLRRVQTPQGFRLSTIRQAYAVADADSDFVATDDTSVVLRALPDVAVHVVEGDETNIKITTPADLALAETILRSRAGSS
ncbi:MAG TPA: 2-C-methyl-D-erythritol 4-phosphate cytidylyltransferase [Mycobacteriales bacterium]|jgi:2-C-methyl-D-erythritol 4-phosphate cytidylyltransferase|nr:2-C-methyl-D-erythritol 4-phosphate cytidylyltransferase [Mycobacteriales bacterium]